MPLAKGHPIITFFALQGGPSSSPRATSAPGLRRHYVRASGPPKTRAFTASNVTETLQPHFIDTSPCIIVSLLD